MSVYAVLGEDDSDAQTLKVLVRRLANDDHLPIKCKSFSGYGEMLRKGRRCIDVLERLGCTHAVVCCDADGPDGASRRREITEKIVATTRLAAKCGIVVAVQELEAWILADISAVRHLFSSWCPEALSGEPERVSSPKEYLEKLSRQQNKRPIYAHATHNPQVAKYLDLDVLYRRCPSFRPLKAFVCGE